MGPVGAHTTTDSWIAAAVLGCLGADLGLLGIWAALAPAPRTARWLATVVCTASWCGIYDPSLKKNVAGLVLLRSGPMNYYYFYCRPVAIVSMAALVVSALAFAFYVVGRRGVLLKRLARDELHGEAGSRQFQVSHLLLLVLVLSLLLGFSVSCRDWFRGTISMRWDLAEEAPVYSAETVMLSALFLVTITLTAAWAALGYGRPWLRLAMAWLAAGVLGFAWAFSFTDPRHLGWNGLFSAGVGLLQSLLLAGVLLMIRCRGYRLVRLPAANELV